MLLVFVSVHSLLFFRVNKNGVNKSLYHYIQQIAEEYTILYLFFLREMKSLLQISCTANEKKQKKREKKRKRQLFPVLSFVILRKLLSLQQILSILTQKKSLLWLKNN